MRTEAHFYGRPDWRFNANSSRKSPIVLCLEIDSMKKLVGFVLLLGMFAVALGCNSNAGSGSTFKGSTDSKPTQEGLPKPPPLPPPPPPPK